MSQSRYYTEEHEIFRDSVRRFLERHVRPHWPEWQERGKVPAALWRQAGEAGFLCTKVSPEYGGGGGDILHCLVIMEEQTRAACTEAAFYLHSDIIAPYIEFYGTEDQRQRFLPPMARGELVAAIAMTEPSGGSDLQALKTTAVRDGAGYRLNGQKTFITNAQLAGLICVAAKTDPSAGAKGISLLLVETEGAEGFQLGRNLDKIGCKAQDASELFFDDVWVPAENLLGGVEGQGFYQLMKRLPEERLIMAMSAVANMECAVADTVAYTRERHAFGQAVIEFQNSRFKLAEAKTTATIARIFLEDCIDRFIEGDLDAVRGAMAKWWTTQMQCDVVDECLQLHGGYGYMLEYDIARRYVDGRLGMIAGGSNEIMKDLVARSL